MSEPTVLLTGFEPFGGDSVNPSWEVAQWLDGDLVAGARVRSLCLPCAFGAAMEPLERAWRRSPVSAVLCLGLAAGRSGLSVERVAINLDDARIPDNRGRQPIDRAVVPGGPAAYFSRLPIKRIAHAWREAGLPGEVSQSAGTFVCNHLFYALMHRLRRRPEVPAGFVHVPMLPSQVTGPDDLRPSMPLPDQVAGVRLALLQALQRGPDRRDAGGAVC